MTEQEMKTRAQERALAAAVALREQRLVEGWTEQGLLFAQVTAEAVAAHRLSTWGAESSKKQGRCRWVPTGEVSEAEEAWAKISAPF